MIKKIVLILALFVSITRLPVVAATTATPAANTKAQELLNRVADKIAEISAEFQKTYQGVIKANSDSKIILTTLSGDKNLTTNDVTSFFRVRSGNSTEVSQANLKVGDQITALGTIDPQTGDMTAREIIAKIARQNLVGSIETITSGVAKIKTLEGAELDVNLGDAIALKKLTGVRILPAKLTDFTESSSVFTIAYVSDPTSATLSALKALVIK